SQLSTFTLVPFEPLPGTTQLSITGTLARAGSVLSVTYLMTGDLDSVLIPPINTCQARKDRLWEQTCFEFFWTAGLQKADQDAYWEFNLSPTGEWNVFALGGYRADLKEEPAFSELPFSVSRLPDGVRVTISVDMSVLLPTDTPWLLGVSAVGVLADGTETFWAIAHPASEADFHDSGSFVVQL
ncbi:MAG: DOMON-like domain-containing protein, partial [Cyanobacteria bacterium J06631_9]